MLKGLQKLACKNNYHRHVLNLNNFNRYFSTNNENPLAESHIPKFVITQRKETVETLHINSNRSVDEINEILNKTKIKRSRKLRVGKNVVEEEEKEEVEDDEEEEEIIIIDDKKKVKLKVTPAMKQYYSFKSKYPDYLLLFRVGDFYEIFNEDAKETSGLLNITLTSKGIKSKKEDSLIPMCGFPSVSLDNFIEKLIRLGRKVAVCDQTEDALSAKKAGRVVKREVTRLVTPGTLFEEKFLKSSQNNYLATFLPLGRDSSSPKNQKFIISWLDMSIGQFFIEQSNFENLSGDLHRISPAEILIPDGLLEDKLYGNDLKNILKPYHLTLKDQSFFNVDHPKVFEMAYSNQEVKDIRKQFSEEELRVSGSILSYTIQNQFGKIPHIYPPNRFSSNQSMYIDFSTMNSLEIMKTHNGNRKGSLLDSLDRTKTSMGSRLLYQRIQLPSLSIQDINSRLNFVEYFYKNEEILQKVRELLSNVHDIERCLARLYIQKAGPRDLSSIGSTLGVITILKSFVQLNLENQPEYGDISKVLNEISDFEELLNELSSAIDDNPPVFSNQGGFIQKGYSKELDRIQGIKENVDEHLEKIQKDCQSKITKVELKKYFKIKENQTHGYFFEIPKKIFIEQEKFIPKDFFIVIESTSSNPRFKSANLVQLNERINKASEEAIQLELEIFNRLSEKVLEFGDSIKFACQVIAQIDISSSFAIIAKERMYCRPKIVKEPKLEIKEGRHPTVELYSENKTFITNDCYLESSDLWLITGANMGGKSTFLRQNALICLMAQLGSWVPAKYAEIGIVDSIFSRVGSSDDLSNDRSTFMVEMCETASILKKATPRSLVIMDEVGRGTSSVDGFSIAQAVIENLINVNQCRTLFATHYHQLTKSLSHPNIKCYALVVREDDDNEILFTHKILPGVTSKSYGIYCANLAGLPENVIKRSKEILNSLENRLIN